MRLVLHLAGAGATLKKFLYAVRPATDFGESSVPTHLPFRVTAI